MIPTGIVTTGWPAVEAKLAEIGIVFFLWQQGIAQIALGKRKDGKYAATVGGVVLSIPRQVGKTFLVGALMVALCLIFPNYTVLWTAHRTRTTTRTFQSLQRLVKRKRIAPHLAEGGGIRTTNGEQEIRFRNGSVILFGAREQGFGRGFEEVDAEVFDEAQILTEKALEDMVAATNQSRHPHAALLFFIGTPPRPVDPGEAFTIKRKKALNGKSKDTVFVEFSADPDADLDDHEQWAKANPSFPDQTPLESMLRLRENLPSDDSWRREALGIWDDEERRSILPNWNALKEDRPQAPEVAALGIASDIDQTVLSLGAVLSGQSPHLALVDRRPATDRTGFAENVARIQKERGRCPVLVRGKNFLIPDLEAAGVTLTLVNSDVRAQAHADLATDVGNGDVRHGGYPDLDAAVTVAEWWTIDNRRSFDARKSDISALDAVALALHGASNPDHGPAIYVFDDEEV